MTETQLVIVLKKRFLCTAIIVLLLLSAVGVVNVSAQTGTTSVSVSMSYKRDLNDGFGYKTKDDKTVYGGDTAIFTVTVANKKTDDATGVKVNDLLPSGLAFIRATPSQGAYDAQSGQWSVGTLVGSAQATLQIKAKVVQSGEIKNTATVPDDSDNSNNHATVTFTARNPVILVHGFNSNSQAWATLMRKLNTEGIRYYAFDYSSENKQDPYTTSTMYFAPWVDQKRTDLGYGSTRYTGKFDIVCHSMGALVTRFYIDASPENAQNIGKWIGIAPVNKGVAAVDVYYHRQLAQTQLGMSPASSAVYFALMQTAVPMKSSAVSNMQTTDKEIIALNEHFSPTSINYHIIEGTKATILGYRTIGKTAAGTYRWTDAGDGIVANAQSELPGVPFDTISGVSHSNLLKNPTVIGHVLALLKS
jgi:uncharacterized repeat protein (TIGR01451 family)